MKIEHEFDGAGNHRLIVTRADVARASNRIGMGC
jgi:hypothetical protein